MKYQEYKSEDFAANESFQNYFLDEDEEDKGHWEKWINENPHKSKDIESAKKLLNSIIIKVSDEETQSALEQLKQKIEIPEKKLLAPKKKNITFPILAIAAVFIGLFIATFFFLNRHTPDWTTLKSDFGKLEQIELPDGSSVFLNSNSKIRFDKNWTNQTIREVWLEGEAYFEVTKNPKKGEKKFIVHVDQSMIEVLGTSFNVYNRNKFVEVALESGSVNFQNKTKTQKRYLMKPKEVIRMNNGTIEQLKDVDLLLFTSWREYKLKLKKTPMTKIINALRDNFGYEVTVNNKAILARKLTATIPIKDVDVLLEALREIYQLDITKKGKRIFIN